LEKPTIFAAFNTIKPRKMKKFLAVFAIAGALVACNNSGESTTTTDTTTTVKTDTTTMNTMADTAHMAGDTTHMMTDTTKH
jgi:ABC-type glycerol-3-phosphate transport system substrate-binding protein